MCMSSFHLSWISIFRDLHPSWHKVENDIVRVQFSMQKIFFCENTNVFTRLSTIVCRWQRYAIFFFYLVVEKEFQFFILMTITPGFYFEQKIQCFYSIVFSYIWLIYDPKFLILYIQKYFNDTYYFENQFGQHDQG